MADTLSTPAMPASGTAATDTAPCMDPCHADILDHLKLLDAVMQTFINTGGDAPMRRDAARVVKFFDEVAAPHHQLEEREVFPLLLARGDERLVQHVQRLQQDHGWLEQDWLELAPQLRALAENNGWIDPTLVSDAARLFAELYTDHIALEESLIYPAARRMKDEADTARQRRRARAAEGG